MVTKFEPEENIIEFDTQDDFYIEKLKKYAEKYFAIWKIWRDPTFKAKLIGQRIGIFDDEVIEEIDDFEEFQKKWQPTTSFMRFMEAELMKA